VSREGLSPACAQFCLALVAEERLPRFGRPSRRGSRELNRRGRGERVAKIASSELASTPGRHGREFRAIRVLHQSARDARAAAKAGLGCAAASWLRCRAEGAARPASNSYCPRQRQRCRLSVSSAIPTRVLYGSRNCSSWRTRIGALGIHLGQPRSQPTRSHIQ
jgi:hypothetical protein